ncbi:MAG: 16S rRNA (uracil(1498)-N(3))-methyltransferase, partial [Candidatus Binatia bacterium]
VTLFDDAGWEHEAIIRAFGDDYGEVAISKSYRAGRESPLELTLALGLTKGEKMDFVIEKATELGVRAIAPFVSRYTVPKLDDNKIARRVERWQKIALSAAKQSGRTHIPEIFSLTGFEELLQRPWPDTLKLLFWETESQQTIRRIYETQRDIGAILTVIGPEGGFSDEEAKKAVHAGFRTVKLGERILRAETAAVAALAIVQSWWGDLG